jgi:phosphatidylglycerol:prolipoprotein diacylglycerol transferase
MFPIHLSLGSKTLFFYEGLYFLIAILAGALWSKLRLKKYNVDVYDFETAFFWTLIGAMIGGRLSHFIFWEPSILLNDPLTFLKIWQGGISITGGIFGGIISAWLYFKKYKLHFIDCFAVISPPLLLGQAIGRVGCFLNGDAHGIQTSSIFGVHFPRHGYLVPQFEKMTTINSFPWDWSFSKGLVDFSSNLSAKLHPTQLYEGFGDLILLTIMVLIFRKFVGNRAFYWIIFFIHTGGYSFIRFLCEYIRADRTGKFYGGMSTLQIGLLLWTLASIILAVSMFIKRESINAHYKEKELKQQNE